MKVSWSSGLAVAMLIVCAGWTASDLQATRRGGPRQPQQAERAPAVNDTRSTREELERWMSELSNWGRWGGDDQLGAVNLITPAKRRQAVALATTGTVVSLSPNVAAENTTNRPPRFALTLTFHQDGRTEWVSERHQLEAHGGATHLDSLCHVAYEGRTYNGFPFREVASVEGGCSKMAIAGLKDKLFTRGILIDLPRLKGLPYLEPGTHIYREDIEAWEERAGVEVSAGDALLVRTGRWARPPTPGTVVRSSGFDPSFLPLLKERDVALLGGDMTHEVGTVPGFAVPIHTVVIVALGINMFDNLDLELLAETAERLQRWEFLLMAAPIPAAQGSGSQINPIAVF